MNMSLIWRCFTNSNSVVESDTEEVMLIPIPKKFPLLRLPEEPIFKVLEFMTPFELISFSLSSKSSKKLAKAMRGQEKFKTDCKLFKMSYTLSLQRVCMQFHSLPNSYWQFLQNYAIYWKIPDPKCKVLKNIAVPSWEPHTTQGNLMGQDPGSSENPQAEFNNIHISSDHVVTIVNKLFNHVWEVYNCPDRVLSLDLESDYIDKTIGFYQKRPPMEYWVLYASRSTNESLIRGAFESQNASKGLYLRCKTDTTFRYNLQSFNSVKENVEIFFSHWVKREEVLNLKSECIALFGSRWFSEDLRVLVQKWRDGWNPEWKQLIVEYNNQYLNLSHCFDEAIEEIPDAKSKNRIRRNSTIRLYKFKKEQIISGRSFKINGFHIVREDGEVATVYTAGTPIGVFFIQSKCSAQFEFPFHRCFYMPRVMWNCQS